MNLHISNRFEDKTEYYNLASGTLFYLKEGEVIDTNILDKLVFIEIRPSGVAIIKTSPPNGIRTSWDFKDVYRVLKAGLKTSLLQNYREVLFKMLLILIATWIFYTHCLSPETNEQKGFMDLQTLLIKKGVPLNVTSKYSHTDLETIFLEVHRETLRGSRIDYFDNVVKQKFQEFLMHKTGRDHLIDKVVRILSLFQPLMDYSMPFLFCDRLYSLEWNTISPLSFFMGRVLKAWLEQSTYVVIFLSLIFVVSGALTLIDLLLLYVYSMLSTSTYFAVGSFIRRPKFFYFLIVVNLYANLLSYDDFGGHFGIIASYYRRNWVTELLSCCFVLLPTVNFQAYFWHQGVANRARMVLGDRYSELKKVQTWGVQITTFKHLWYLLPLGGVNAVLLVLFSAFNFCCLTSK